MNTTILSVAIPYVSNQRNRSGNLATGISLPTSSIITCTRLICTDDMTFTGAPVVNIGTSLTPNLLLNSFLISSVASVGNSTVANQQSRITDNTNKVFISITNGTITSGSFILIVDYYFPIMQLPNLSYTPINSQATMRLMSNIHTYDIPADNNLYYIKMFKVIGGPVTVTKVTFINTAVSSVGVISNISAGMATTDDNDNRTTYGTLNNFVQNFDPGWIMWSDGSLTNNTKGNADASNCAANAAAQGQIVMTVNPFNTYITMIISNNAANLVNYTGTFDCWVEYQPQVDGASIISMNIE